MSRERYDETAPVEFQLYLLEDGDEPVDEAGESVVGDGPVADGVDERPQRVAARPPRRVGRVQVGADRVEEAVDRRLRRTGLVGEHVTDQSERCLVHLTTDQQTDDRPPYTAATFLLWVAWDGI